MAAAPVRARNTLRRWVTWQGIRLTMRVVARRQQRKVDYSLPLPLIMAVRYGGEEASDGFETRKSATRRGIVSISGCGAHARRHRGFRWILPKGWTDRGDGETDDAGRQTFQCFSKTHG